MYSAKLNLTFASCVTAEASEVYSQVNEIGNILLYNTKQVRVRIREAKLWKIPTRDADWMGYYVLLVIL